MRIFFCGHLSSFLDGGGEAGEAEHLGGEGPEDVGHEGTAGGGAVLLGLGGEDAPDVNNHDEGGHDQEGDGRGLHEVEVAEDETLNADEAQNEGVGAVAAAADLEGVVTIVELEVLAADVEEGATDARERPKDGQTAAAQEGEGGAAKLAKEPIVNEQLEELLLVEGVGEDGVDAPPVLVGEGEVLDGEVAHVVVRDPVHEDVAQAVSDEEDHNDVDGVEGGGEGEVALVVVRLLLLLLVVLLLLLLLVLLNVVDALEGAGLGLSGGGGLAGRLVRLDEVAAGGGEVAALHHQITDGDGHGGADGAAKHVGGAEANGGAAAGGHGVDGADEEAGVGGGAGEGIGRGGGDEAGRRAGGGAKMTGGEARGGEGDGGSENLLLDAVGNSEGSGGNNGNAPHAVLSFSN